MQYRFTVYRCGGSAGKVQMIAGYPWIGRPAKLFMDPSDSFQEFLTLGLATPIQVEIVDGGGDESHVVKNPTDLWTYSHIASNVCEADARLQERIIETTRIAP